jgi:hypothetical protein
MQLLIAELFINKFSIALNWPRQLADYVPAITFPTAFSRSIRNSDENDVVGRNCEQF